ncbi:MAG: ATP-binding protein [Kiloniellales bacterium]
MGASPRDKSSLIAVAVLVAAAILLLDLRVPLGVAGGVPYVALVLLGWWFDKLSHIFLLAAVSSVLTVVGYYYSPEGGIPWVVLANRFLAFFAIWVTAALLAYAKRAETALEIAHDELQQRSAAALRESEERFKTVVNYAPAKIHIKDKDGRYLLVNRLAEKLYGVSDEEAKGKTTHEIFPKEMADSFQAHDQVVLETGQVTEQEEEWTLEDGVHTFLSVKFPIRDGDGNIAGVGAIGTDITERKRAEAVLLEARDLAETANRAKSEFLAAMSHELRTPLNAIIGFSEIMKSETFGPVGSVKYRGYAEDINASGHHLLDLINDILDLSKVESGADELHEENIEAQTVLHSVRKLVQQRAENGGVELELDIPDDLPMLRADRRKLTQILVNLVTNAIKFTNAGGHVTVRSWCEAQSGFMFQVVDTGIGITAEDIPKALLQFGQVDSDLNRRFEGTGLGLPLAKTFVELHGGSLDLQSQVGVGTTVTLRFPSQRIIRPRQDLGSQGEGERGSAETVAAHRP